MDRNASPTYQEASASQSIADTKSLIEHISTFGNSNATALVEPILTPRFAICCTNELLSGLQAIAKEHPDMAIQTHISENASEVAFTKELFSECATYAGVYDQFGLLRAKTILAHAVHLEDEELNLVKQREAGISHCPTSNFNLRSGMARVGEMLDRGIKVRSSATGDAPYLQKSRSVSEQTYLGASLPLSSPPFNTRVSAPRWSPFRNPPWGLRIHLLESSYPLRLYSIWLPWEERTCAA